MGVTMFAKRLSWYLRALGRNPLVRAGDRLEALAVLGVFIVAVLALPVVARAESQIRDVGIRNAETQAQTRHPVAAVVVTGSTGLSTDFDGPAYVRAQWHEGAQLRTENVISPSIVKAGEPLQLWLDDKGKVVTAPLSADDAKLAAISAASVLWAAMVSFAVLAAVTVRLRLDRSRDRAWDRELHLLAHNDDGWANRHI
jgi:hypothetical protein